MSTTALNPDQRKQVHEILSNRSINFGEKSQALRQVPGIEDSLRQAARDKNVDENSVVSLAFEGGLGIQLLGGLMEPDKAIRVDTLEGASFGDLVNAASEKMKTGSATNQPSGPENRAEN